MNRFSIDESTDGIFTLRVSSGYICRCFSYDDAIRAYEDYLLIQELKKTRGIGIKDNKKD